jgi:hypothetical protein
MRASWIFEPQRRPVSAAAARAAAPHQTTTSPIRADGSVDGGRPIGRPIFAENNVMDRSVIQGIARALQGIDLPAADSRFDDLLAQLADIEFTPLPAVRNAARAPDRRRVPVRRARDRRLLLRTWQQRSVRWPLPQASGVQVRSLT